LIGEETRFPFTYVYVHTVLVLVLGEWLCSSQIRFSEVLLYPQTSLTPPPPLQLLGAPTVTYCLSLPFTIVGHGAVGAAVGRELGYCQAPGQKSPGAGEGGPLLK
jgi:hypothetical protein